MDAMVENGVGQGTPEALVAAARKLFTLHGYEGASVRAITAAAGANLGAVTYHFGSKRALYERVIAASVEPLVERVTRVAEGPGTPMERVADVVRAYFDHLMEDPDLPRLILQVMAVGGEAPEALPRLIRGVHGRLMELVVSGQRDGSMRAGNPVQMAIGIVSHPLHLVLLRRQVRAFIGWDLEDPATRREAREGAVAFACGGLAARGGGVEGGRA